MLIRLPDMTLRHARSEEKRMPQGSRLKSLDAIDDFELGEWNCIILGVKSKMCSVGILVLLKEEY